MFRDGHALGRAPVVDAVCLVISLLAQTPGILSSIERTSGSLLFFRQTERRAA